MPIVYGVNLSPFVRKVRVALAEKGVAYELEPVIPVNVSDEFRKISPLGKIPAYRDGERALCDSSVICAYIEKVHPNPPLYPSDAYEFARALWFEEYADSAMVAVVGPKIFLQKIVNPLFFGQQTDEAVLKKAVEEELPPLYDYLEGQIVDANALVGGKFSIADIAVASQFVNLRHTGYLPDPARWPKLARYVANQHERPTFKSLIDEESAQLPPR